MSLGFVLVLNLIMLLQSEFSHITYSQAFAQCHLYIIPTPTSLVNSSQMNKQ
jgi:hypothetical protein